MDLDNDTPIVIPEKAIVKIEPILTGTDDSFEALSTESARRACSQNWMKIRRSRVGSVLY
jgi:hypothetical protein